MRQAAATAVLSSCWLPFADGAFPAARGGAASLHWTKCSLSLFPAFFAARFIPVDWIVGHIRRLLPARTLNANAPRIDIPTRKPSGRQQRGRGQRRSKLASSTATSTAAADAVPAATAAAMALSDRPLLACQCGGRGGHGATNADALARAHSVADELAARPVFCGREWDVFVSRTLLLVWLMMVQSISGYILQRYGDLVTRHPILTYCTYDSRGERWLAAGGSCCWDSAR
jgi:hypothetical protein